MQFADRKEAEAFLAANPQVRSIELFLIDANGVPRGKLLHRDELLAIYDNGRPLPSSILALTLQGEDVEGTGLVWDVADADCWTYPLPGSLTVQPWRTTPTGQLHEHGVTLEALTDTLRHASVVPVLTAHPTEVQRQSVLDSQRAIRKFLSLLDQSDITEDEREQLQDKLARVVLMHK